MFSESHARNPFGNFDHRPSVRVSLSSISQTPNSSRFSIYYIRHNFSITEKYALTKTQIRQ